MRREDKLFWTER